MSLTRPNPFLSKWAENGERVDVPNSGADHTNGRADIQTGFPKETMVSVMNGGVPPWGKDHNGILNRITQDLQWTQAGGFPVYDKDLCEAISGYPAGVILQTSDTSKPWVLWQNTIDGNINNPDNNKINISQTQNGWVRYPVISGAEGSILYFTTDGKLEAASATITSEKWVSSSTGNDDTGKGTEDSPYFSIDKAISDTPGSGSVTIYLKAQDTHYWSPKGQAGLFGGWLYVGSRKVMFRPYNDPVLEDAIIQTQNRFSDGNQGYCTEQITRPKLVLTWKYHSTIDSTGNDVVTNTQFCGINGTSNDFSASFYGIEFFIDRVDELSRDDLPLTTGWAWNGGIYRFIGCIFNNLPYKGQHYWLGAGGSFNTTYSFPYPNFFKENMDTTTALVIGFPSNLTINCVDSSDSWSVEGTNYTVIANNAQKLLAKNSSYYGDSLKILSSPSKRYAYINPDYVIA